MLVGSAGVAPLVPAAGLIAEMAAVVGERSVADDWRRMRVKSEFRRAEPEPPSSAWIDWLKAPPLTLPTRTSAASAAGAAPASSQRRLSFVVDPEALEPGDAVQYV